MVDFAAMLGRLPSRADVVGSVEQLQVAREAASPFIAGEGVGDAVEAVAGLQASGMAASVLHLPAPDAGETTLVASMQVIDALGTADLSVGTDLAVSAVALGLGRAPIETVAAKVAGLCRAAAEAGMTVTLTSVAHALVADVLALHSLLVQEHPDLGVTLTANLHRTEGDCLDLAASGTRVRLIRAEQAEQPGVAFTDAHEIDKAYVRCTRLLLDNGARPVLATEDDRLIEIATALGERADRSPGEYAFQFRRGVRDARAAELVAGGATVAVLVPFGPGWGAYVTRWISPTASVLGRAVGAVLSRSES